MKRYGMYVILAGLIVGCGGAGDTGLLPSLYQGAWTGSWNSSDANDTGAISFTITADGSLSGTISTKAATGTIAGHVDKTGSLTAIASFTAGGNMVIGGKVTMSSGRISSNFNYVTMGIQYGGSFDCGAGSSTGSTATTSGGG